MLMIIVYVFFMLADARKEAFPKINILRKSAKVLNYYIMHFCRRSNSGISLVFGPCLCGRLRARSSFCVSEFFEPCVKICHLSIWKNIYLDSAHLDIFPFEHFHCEMDNVEIDKYPKGHSPC